MGIANLDKIFHPKSVAVIGASEKSGTVGFALMANLINGNCGSSGAGGAVIISAGGKETGKKGRAIEEAIKEAASESDSGLRIIGPNCLGIICVYGPNMVGNICCPRDKRH